MLRTNLASRPFYNERAVTLAIGATLVLAAALTAFNAAEIMSLQSRNGELTTRAQASEAKASQYREQARVIRQSLGQQDADVVRAAAKEANVLIDRRAFSWTDLFNRFEQTLPAEVRIVSVRPQTDREGRTLVVVTVISRRVENLESFIDQLERTGAFRDILSRQEEALDDGAIRSVIQGYYTHVAAAVPTSTSESETGAAEPSGNATPEKPVSAVPGTGISPAEGTR